jgi:hypothetical protein
MSGSAATSVSEMAAAGKRMLRGQRHANAFVKQFFVSQVAQRTSLRGRNDQSELKPAIAYPIENIFVGPNRAI